MGDSDFARRMWQVGGAVKRFLICAHACAAIRRGRSSCCALNSAVIGHARCILSKMFILAEMCDVVRIEPRRFAQDTDQEITDELNKKFANKVGCFSS